MYFNIDHQVVTLATGLIPQFEFQVERQGLLPKQSLTSVLTFIESEDYLSLQDELDENDVVFVPSTLMDQVHTTSRKIIAPDPKLAYFLVHNYIANKLSEVKSRSVISESSEISSACFIDELGVVIGNDCVIEPNAVILCGTVISDRSIVRAGAVIGANGFEFKRTSTGVLSVLHYGNTFVGSDVEIGSNTTVA